MFGKIFKIFDTTLERFQKPFKKPTSKNKSIFFKELLVTAFVVTLFFIFPFGFFPTSFFGKIAPVDNFG